MTDGNPKNSSPWPLVGLFGVIVLALAVGGYWLYREQEQSVREARYHELKAIAELKVDQIVAWRRERLADAEMNSSGIVRTYVVQWLKAFDDAALQAKILARLQVYREQQGYQNIILAAPDGCVLLSLNPPVIALEVNAENLVAQAVSSHSTVFGDFFRCPVCDRIHLDVAVPILDDDSHPVAVLVLRTNPEQFLYPLIQSWPTPSRSAETLLIRKEGDDVLFLNTLRHRPAPPLTLRISLAQIEVPAVQAGFGKAGVFEGLDYRGEEVLADLRPVPGSPWFMVAKVDADELLAEARYRGGVIGLFLLAAMLLVGLGAGFVYKHRGKRTFQALYRAERERREAQEEIRATLYGIGDAVIATDAAGRVTRMNPVAEVLTGWSEGEALRRPLTDVFRIFNEVNRAEVENPVARVLREGRVVGLANHTLLTARDGTEHPIADSGAPIRSEEGEIIGVAVVFRDQTEERKRLAALRESEEMTRSILRVAPIGIGVVKERIIVEVNLRVCEMTGYSREELIGSSALMLYPTEEEFAYVGTEKYRQITKRGTGTVETRWRRKDGAIIDVLLSSTPLDFSDLSRGVTFTALDISERKRAEEERKKLEAQLVQAQKLESVGRLAGGVAHDFNNMLGAIMGHAELALMKADSTAPLHHDLEEILKAGRRSADLIRQLLAFARKQTVSPKVLDLNDAVSGMLKMLQRLIGEEIDLVWKPGHELWPVKIDPSQLDQLLANLAVNARDAISGVGAVTIETENVVLDQVYFADHVEGVPGEYVLMAISDSGCGMDRETMANIFEPFFTTKEVGQGTGLGLSTVYGIVKQNQGFINVYSELGQGTSFKIYFLRFATDPLEIVPEGVEEHLRGGNETVLLVEDEEAILKLGKMMLEQLGYTVLATKSPGEAVHLAEEYSGEIHLLITDVVMPEMNGRELAERLIRVEPGLKCLYMSGYTADMIAHRGVLEEGTQFIPKPFSRKDLAAKVREVLGP